MIQNLIDILETKRRNGTRAIPLSMANIAFLQTGGRPSPEQTSAAPEPTAAASDSLPRLQKTTPIPDQTPATIPGNAVPPSIKPASNQAISAASTLAELDSLLQNHTNCPNCQVQTERLLGRGNHHATLMFIGGMPSRADLVAGQLFSGAEGQLLDKMIRAMKFDPNNVYLSTAMKCHPHDADATTDESVQKPCVAFIKRQIELIQPQAIVLFGAIPLRLIVGLSPFDTFRGQWHDHNGVACIATRHPAYLLRVPSAKRQVWSELQALMERFGHHAEPRER